MSRIDKLFETWTKNNNVQDLDAKRASRQIFEAGWNARGNPWATVINNLMVLAFAAYLVTFLAVH